MEIDNKHMQQEHEHEHSPTHIYKHENYPPKKKKWMKKCEKHRNNIYNEMDEKMRTFT